MSDTTLATNVVDLTAVTPAADEKKAETAASSKPKVQVKKQSNPKKPTKKSAAKAMSTKNKKTTKTAVKVKKTSAASNAGHKAQTQVHLKVWGQIVKDAKAEGIRPADIVRKAIYKEYKFKEA